MITQINNSLSDQFISDFEEIMEIQSLEEQSLRSLRKKAFEQFNTAGFPTTKVEDWKHTNVIPFLNNDYTTEEPDINLTEDDLLKARIDSLDCYKIVLLNGKYQPYLSDAATNDNIVLMPLKEAAQFASFQQYFAQIDFRKHHFTALNTALFHDGLFMEIINKAIINKPLHIIHISGAKNPSFLQPRHLIVVGKQAELTIIESHVSLDNKAGDFVNNVSELVVGENASLQHYTIQTKDEKSVLINHTEVNQESSSIYNNYVCSFPGARLIRNNLNIVLSGENTESHLYGLYLVGAQQLIDNHTLVDHQKPHCRSNQLYKGVIKANAIGVFNGKVWVRKDAQKTNAFQQNNNLMLSPLAIVESKPQLEIFADDVKCSHGSTVGRFNEDALFYLQSRGIGEIEASNLLINAFVFDVTEKIPIAEVRVHINNLIEQSLNELQTA